MRKKGFTLIELLVVIAIISLLLTITIVALKSYKDKAKNVRIAGALSDLRPVASQFYTDNNNSYQNICSGGTINESIDTFGFAMGKIEQDVYNLNGKNLVYCYSSQNEYCIQTVLNGGGYFCVDSAGFAVENGISKCTASNLKCN